MSYSSNNAAAAAANMKWNSNTQVKFEALFRSREIPYSIQAAELDRRRMDSYHYPKFNFLKPFKIETIRTHLNQTKKKLLSQDEQGQCKNDSFLTTSSFNCLF